MGQRHIYYPTALEGLADGLREACHPQKLFYGESTGRDHDLWLEQLELAQQVRAAVPDHGSRGRQVPTVCSGLCLSREAAAHRRQVHVFAREASPLEPTHQPLACWSRERQAGCDLRGTRRLGHEQDTGAFRQVCDWRITTRWEAERAGSNPIPMLYKQVHECNGNAAMGWR